MTMLRLLLGFLGVMVFAVAGAAEMGALPARTWGVRELQVGEGYPHPPFYALAQSKEGLIYAGDGSGILEFDGRQWRRLQLDSHGAITMLGAPRSGGLVVGGAEYLRVFPDALAPERAQDPGREIPGGLRGSAEFWEFAEDARQWCARSTSLLVCSSAERFRGFRSQTGFGRMFQGHDAIYVQEDGVGLSQVLLDGPKLVPGGEAFADIGIFTLVESVDGRFTVITKEPVGIWEWGRGTTPNSRSEPSLERVNFPIGVGLQPIPGRLVLPEENGGVAILGANGALQDRIEASDLGVAPGAQALMFDREGGLWVAWRTAISRIEYPSRLSIFPMPESVYGESLSLTRTSSGLSTWRGRSAFVLVPTQHSARWTLQEMPTKTEVIMEMGQVHGVDYTATVRGLWPLRENKPALPEEVVFMVAAVAGEAGGVWAGLRKGIVRLNLNAERWTEESRQKLSFDVVSIKQTDPHTLWLGSFVGRVAHLHLGSELDLKDATVSEFGQEAGLPQGTITAETLDDRVLFLVKGAGFLEFREGRFEPSAAVPFAETGGITAAKIIDNKQMLVSGSAGRVKLLKRDIAGVFRLQASVFDEIAGIGITRSIHADPDGIIWLAADSGIVRVDPKVELPRAKPPLVLIREVSTDKGALFAGAGRVPAVAVKEGSNLRFGYALPSYHAPEMNRYRSRIRHQPGDEAWSNWSNETRRDFTNLPAGALVFEVEALDAAGVSGGVASVPITVSAPWYRRSWALVAFWILGLALAWIGVQWRVRALRARSAELERLVAIKTEALLIAATTDPLTGLWNRHRFGEWMRDEVIGLDAKAPGAKAEDAVDLFVCVIDLDHFKRVNDQHGHAAGDVVLKAVANRLLSFKRKEDLIFRFGGEEFVYFGVRRHRDEGKKLAEDIVDEIAHINVELDSGVLIEPKASVGWSVYPFYRERADLFSLDFVVGVADRALYLAKQHGRNRACGYLPNLAVDGLDRTQADWRTQVFSRHPDFLKKI